MRPPASPDITSLLTAWSEGDQAALAELVPRVYGELHRLAHHHMRGEAPGATLQTTALINEAYLRLVDTNRMRWESRGHFLSVAAQAMRRILVDAARTREAAKRGGAAVRVPIEDVPLAAPERSASLVALDEALTSLSALDPRKGQVVELRYFGGLTVAETAEVLHVSQETVHRDWHVAKAWLLRELSQGGTAP